MNMQIAVNNYTDFNLLFDIEHNLRNQSENRLYLISVNGDSMVEAGITDGSLLVVEANKESVTGDIIIAKTSRGWTIKRVKFNHDNITLYPENSLHSPIYIRKGEYFECFGVVKAAIQDVA